MRLSVISQGMFMGLVVFLRKLRLAVTPRNWLLRTRLDNGALIAGYNRAGWGGRGIYVFRDALEPELASLSRFLKPGFVFVDIGANVGVFTVKAAKEIGESGIVIAIEPFIESARQLSRNINMNRYRNCRVRNFCIGQKTGQMKFYLNKDKPNSFSLIQDSDADSISVFSVSLNDLCAWEGIVRLDYLKIDAEGAEQMILEGGGTGDRAIPADHPGGSYQNAQQHATRVSQFLRAERHQQYFHPFGANKRPRSGRDAWVDRIHLSAEGGGETGRLG
jgi:FkbM family methyltransferase